jgi:Ca-activated chloride channel family protein
VASRLLRSILVLAIATVFGAAAKAQNIAQLEGGTQSTALQGGTTGSLMQAGVQTEGGPINILFILDCSYSMKEKLGGDERKMTVAKQVLQSALSRIPNDVNLGLRVFGQSFARSNPLADCQSTALLVPLGQHNRGAIIRQVNQIEPYGMTPLEYAVSQAAGNDFRDVEGSKTLILITDGADTCGGNPCAYIRSLPYLGIKLKVDVVGVDLKRDPSARAQLNCVAERSGGKYYDANTAAELVDSVSKSVGSALSGKVLPHPGANGKNTETAPELVPTNPKP